MKKITKTEQKRRINEEFYKFINNTYPDWYIDQHGDGGRYTLCSPSGKTEDQIEYHIGRHELCTLNNCSKETDDIEKELEKKLKEIINKYK